MRILIAAHDSALGTFIVRSLEKDEHIVNLATDAAPACVAIAGTDYDLLLLDMDMPEQRGAQILEMARRLGSGMRIMVLSTGASDLETRIAQLEAGADDCLAKPFAMRELKVRCRSLARRQDGGAVLRCGELELNRLQQSLERDTESIALSRREFSLLEYLMMNRGRCVSRATLLDRVWGAVDTANGNVVDVYINYLRRKLGASGSLIETVRGQGYRIAAAAPAAFSPMPMPPIGHMPAYQSAIA